jgi:DNA repair exonuclease SbcCD ATPase subunit
MIEITDPNNHPHGFMPGRQPIFEILFNSLKYPNMKKTIYIIMLNAVIAGAFLASCESKEQKVENAKQNVKEAKEELKQTKQELNAEYPAFKRDAEEKILANDKRIAALREKLAKPGKAPLDDAREQRIKDLEKRNAELRRRLYDYEKEHSDWESFKRQFNHDMDNLGDAFRDFGNDLKK